MFYNPAMAGDRDIAVAFATAWRARVGHPLAGWEVTAATGVRGLRLLNESGAFDRFLLTEANGEAVAVLAENAAPWAAAQVRAQDGRVPPAASCFDYVDIDPYGSPVPFVPAALAALRPGGVLAVTATDLMVLAGAQPGACERRYGARPLRGRLGPEGGLRILLAYLARAADSVGRSVAPLLGYVRDHHLRAYVATGTPPAPAPVATIAPTAWSGPELGVGAPFGPLWLGPLFDGPLVRALRTPAHAARPRETGRFLARLADETLADVPFYYEANRLAADLGLVRPPALAPMLAGLRAAGFRAARTHARPEGFRTDAPRPDVERLAQRLSSAG